jgi:hypothetical protein
MIAAQRADISSALPIGALSRSARATTGMSTAKSTPPVASSCATLARSIWTMLKRTPGATARRRASAGAMVAAADVAHGDAEHALRRPGIEPRACAEPRA